MPYIRQGDPVRKPGEPPVPPITEVRVARPEDTPAPTHEWVFVRHAKGHTFTPSIGVAEHFGPGRHYVTSDRAREIMSQESRVAAEEYSFKDPTPTARLLLGGGRAVRLAPDELDQYIGRA